MRSLLFVLCFALVYTYNANFSKSTDISCDSLCSYSHVDQVFHLSGNRLGKTIRD